MQDSPERPSPPLRSTAIIERLDGLIVRLTAGMALRDLRDLARGDAPRHPNPRLRLHAESFWFHIKPAYYHEAATKFTHTFRLGLLSTYLFFV